MKDRREIMSSLPGGDLQWVPPKYDASRDRVTDDRDSREPVILAGLMRDMDELSRDVRASGDNGMARTMADTWEAIREAMKS